MRLWVPLLLFFCPDALLSFQHSAGETIKPSSIEGRVIDANSGEVVKKALVILRRGNDRGIGAYSDAAGNFTFQSVEPGSYTLSAERDGYIADRGNLCVTVDLATGRNLRQNLNGNSEIAQNTVVPLQSGEIH